MIKNVKKGFSLAEVLIAIAIIGVVAAINIPTVVSETQNRKLAASLGRNVESIETGCQLIIQQASEVGGESIEGIFPVRSDLSGGVSSGTDTRVASNIFTDNTADIFNTVPQTAAQMNNYSVFNINGNAANPERSAIATNYAISSKFGSLYGYRNQQESNFNNLNDPIVGYVYIDVNGKNSPNRYGRDIFLFGLTDSCHTIPAGSSRINSLNSNIPVETSGCTGNNPSNGLSCTSRVVKNGYRMDY